MWAEGNQEAWEWLFCIIGSWKWCWMRVQSILEMFYFLNCQHKCLMLILNSFGLLLFLLVSTVCFLVMILADVELLYYIHSLWSCTYVSYQLPTICYSAPPAPPHPPQKKTTPKAPNKEIDWMGNQKGWIWAIVALLKSSVQISRPHSFCWVIAGVPMRWDHLYSGKAFGFSQYFHSFLCNC